ncbi:sialate O-acetylesterase (plasmid) [Limimaricola variabilis]
MRLGTGLGLCAVAAPEAGPPVIVPVTAPLLLIVAGQSNADKQGTSGATPAAKYTGMQDVEIWNPASGGFEPYAPGSNAGDDSANAWGSEAEFAHQLRQAGVDRPIRIVKRAQGGTGLPAEAGRDDWHPSIQTSGRMLFEQLESRVATARAALSDTPEEVTIWTQGEYDMANGHGADYAGNFAHLLAEFRARISAGLFIVERTRPRLDSATATANTWAVRKAQLDVALADGNAVVIDTDAATGGAPFSELHPRAAWAEDCGRRAYRAWTGSYAGHHGEITDAAPDAFAFAARSGAAPSSPVTSELVTPVGYERDAPITVTGGAYRIANPDDTVAVDWTTAPGRIHKHQKVQLRVTSSAEAETATQATLTIGGVTGVWSVTTAAAAPPPSGVAFIGAGPPDTAKGAHVVAMPAGLQAGDLLLLHVGTHSANHAATTPPGWTALPEVRSGNASSDQVRGVLYWKIAADGEPGVELTQGASYYSTGIVSAWRGVDPADPLAVVQPGTTATGNSLVAGLVAANVPAGTHVVYAVVYANLHSANWGGDPDLSDFAERYDVTRQGSSGVQLSMTTGSGGAASAQSVGDAVTATIDGGASRNSNPHLLCLRPAAG